MLYFPQYALHHNILAMEEDDRDMEKGHNLLWIASVAFLSAVGFPTGEAGALGTVRVASSLNRPIQVTAPEGDHRLFIVEQPGVIRILENNEVLGTPFLDIDVKIPNITGNDERGLLGITFDPDYAENGYFYVHYTNLSSDGVIARYSVSADPNVADVASEEIILVVDQPFTNHNGGDLHFGPDGYFYIGLGDGGSGGDPGDRAQCLDEILGKMLRIDVSDLPYSIPPDNPFVGVAGAREEIWALGLRNPWRFSFDRLTGDMYIGDVGQNVWEEIDFQPADSEGGENYGWRIMEGDHCYTDSDCNDPPILCNDPSLTDPIHEYSHATGCSVSGGFVYRGPLIPSLQGTYFFADFCSPTIWSFEYDGNSVNNFTDRTAELAPGGGLSIGSIAGFGEDGFGELYICDRDGGASGEVYRIVSDVADTAETGMSFPLRLGRAFPNPFTESARIRLDLDRPVSFDLKVVDASGRRIRTLAHGPLGEGSREFAWDGLDEGGHPVPSGVYFFRATTGGKTEGRPAHLLR